MGRRKFLGVCVWITWKEWSFQLERCCCQTSLFGGVFLTETWRSPEDFQPKKENRRRFCQRKQCDFVRRLSRWDWLTWKNVNLWETAWTKKNNSHAQFWWMLDLSTWNFSWTNDGFIEWWFHWAEQNPRDPAVPSEEGRVWGIIYYNLEG